MSSIEYRNSAISSTLQHMESTIENRKSQVLLAAQLIDNEVQNVRHLKRQSLGSIDLLVDPEMEYTVNQPGPIPERPQLSTRKTHNGVFAFSKKENNSKVRKVRHSLSEAQIDERYEDNRTVDVTSGTEGSKEEEAEDTANSTPREKPHILRSELSRNLLWVSADKHPSVKPRNYLQLVQNTLHQMSEHNSGDNQGSSSSSSAKISKDDENTTGNDFETTRFEEDTEAIIRDTRRLSTLAKRPSRLRRSYIQFSEKEEEENERNEAAVTERRISLLEDRDDWKRRSINSDILINSSFASVNEINVTLKDLSDEITKISSKAGLTQDDAVTLATTLSMASSLSLEGDITRSTLETSDLNRDTAGITENDEEYASALVDNDAKNTAKTSLLRGKCNRYRRRNSGAQGHESPWEVFTGDLGLTNTYQQEQEHEENGPKSASEEDKEEEASLRTILEDLGSSHYSSDSRDDTFSVHRATLDNQQVGPDGFTSEESFDQGSLIFGSDEFGKSANGKPKLEVEPKLLPSPLIVKTEPLPLDTSNNSKDKNSDNDNNNEEDHNDDKRTKKMWFWSMTKSKGDRSSEASKKQSTFESRMASLFRRREKHLVIGDTQTEVKNDDPVTPSTPRAPESNKGPTNRFSIFSRATAPQSNEATPSSSNLSSPNNIGETNDITGGFILSSLKKVRSLSFDNGKPHLGKNYRSISATSPSLSDTEQGNEVTDKQHGDQVQPRHLHHEKTKGRTASRLLEKISFQNDTTNSSKQKRNDGSNNNSSDKPVKCRARKPYYRQTLLPLQQQRQRQLQLELQFQQRRQREVALIQQKQREKEQQEQQQLQQKLQNPPDQISVSNNGQNDDTGKTSLESNKAVVTPRQTDQKQAQQPVVLRTRDDKKRSKRGPTHDCQGSSSSNGSDSGAREMHLPPRKPTFDDIVRPAKPNGPQQLRDSAFGFPLPSMTPAVVVMFDHRLPITAERAIYRLSHIKLGNPKRPLREQVLLSNFMYAYLNLVDHTLYMEQAATTGATAVDDAPRNNTLGGGGFPAMKSTAAGPSSPILPSQQTAIGA